MQITCHTNIMKIVRPNDINLRYRAQLIILKSIMFINLSGVYGSINP
jgi:hypothetical protein